MSDPEIPLRVLYAEDEKAMAQQMQRALEGDVATLRCVANGQEALEALAQDRFDVVITDIQMPVMNGLELARRIKAKNPDFPIIITSAFNDEEYLIEAINIGVKRYLFKPVNFDLLHAYLLDITQMVQLRKENRRQQEMLIVQSRVSNMGEMLSAIAHHWRQPLSVINLMAESIKEAYDHGELDSSTLDGLVGEISQRVHHLSDTINQLRRFQTENSESKTVNLHQTINEALNLIEPQLEEMKIDRQLAGDKELCIQLSGLDLRNAIYNLLTNARDAICQKQRNGHRNGADTLTIDITRNANDAVITIEDSGGGFSDEALKKLYEPFFTTKERGQGQGVISGTGIGLYITRKIIEECGGKMAVENSRQGAKIALTLPLS